MSRNFSGLESFQLPTYSADSSALSNSVQDMIPRTFSTPEQTLPRFVNFAPDIYGPGWINDLPQAPVDQIKRQLDGASGIVFSSEADNANDKVEPDFFLGEDGMLRANPKKTAPNEDGSVNIQLQTKNKSETDAIKYADQMQKASIKDLINYFRQSNPNGRVPQHWLDMLSKEPDLPPAPAPISTARADVTPESTQQTRESPRAQQSHPERSNGGSGGAGGGGNSGGGGDGGGGGGGGHRRGGDGNSFRSNDVSSGPEVNLNASLPKAMQIMDYFVEKGLTPQQAAGTTGNLERESHLDSGITERGGSGYGLAQWTGERREELQSYASTTGQPVSDLKTQLDFLWKEMTTKEPGALQAFQNDPNMSAAEAAKVFCEKFERPGVVAMNDRTSGAEQFFAAYKNGGDQGASTVSAPAPTEFNERLVSAIKQQDAAMSGTGKCATAVQRALAACGLPEFLGSGNGGEMDKPLLASKKFTEISISECKPGDIIVRPPSANPHDSSVYGDISVVTARNGDKITQTNDASYQFKKDNPRYDGKATFLRYTG